MSESVARCSNCKAPVPRTDDGAPPRFCHLCGARMAADPRPDCVLPVSDLSDGVALGGYNAIDLAALSNAAVPARTGGWAVPTESAADPMAPGGGLLPVLDGVLPPSTSCSRSRAPDETSTWTSTPVYCKDLTVEFNRARLFIEGVVLRFEFRFKFHSDGIENLQLHLNVGDGKDAQQQIHLCRVIARKGMVWPHALSYCPRFVGNPAVTLRIGYRLNGEERWFETQFSITIHSQQQNAREALNRAATVIHIEADRGSIVDFSHALGHIEQLKRDARADDSLNAMLSRIENVPSAWSRLELFPAMPSEATAVESSGLPLGQPPPGARSERLTLVVGGWRIHLLSGTSWQLGRSSACDVMTRLFPAWHGDRRAWETALAAINNSISRRHARIEIHGRHCVVRDLGPDPKSGIDRPSAFGTFVGTDRIPPGGSAELPADTATAIGLGDAVKRGSRGWMADVTPLACPTTGGGACPMENRCPPGAPACVVIRRRDSVKETYVLLNRCCSLAAVLPEARPLVAWRQGAAFAIRGVGDPRWIQPGDEVPLGGGRSAQVWTFRQIKDYEEFIEV